MSDLQPQQIESLLLANEAMIVRTRALVIENGDLLQASERIAGMVETLRDRLEKVQNLNKVQKEALKISHDDADELRRQLQTLQT